MTERPPGLASGVSLRLFVGDSLKDTIATRLDEVAFLLAPPMYDDEGNYLGVSEPLISEAEARELLDLPLGSPEAVR